MFFVLPNPNLPLNEWKYVDSFKSNQTLHFCQFLDFLDIFEGNSRLLYPSAVKIYSLVDECDPGVRVRLKYLTNTIKCVKMRVKVAWLLPIVSNMSDFGWNFDVNED